MCEKNDGYLRNLNPVRFEIWSKRIKTKNALAWACNGFYGLRPFYLSDEAFSEEAFSEDDFSDEALSLLLFPLSFSADFDSLSPDLALPEERPAPEGERWSVA